VIERGIAEKIAVLTPRKPLCWQAANDFCDPNNRALTNCSYEIVESINEIQPSKGTEGYTTTHQAIMADVAGINEWEFINNKYALVIDEFHHLKVGSKGHQAIQALINHAECVLLMTGTLYRHDKKPLAFLNYVPANDGQWKVDKKNGNFSYIEYSRRDALAEKAILPIEFYQVDGSASWLNSDGTKSQVKSLTELNDDSSKALMTALQTDFAKDILDKGMASFVAHLQKNQRAKALIVSSNILAAKQHLKHIAKFGLSCEIATTDDEKQAVDAIKNYIFGETRVLVSVGKAYEGLNNPSITHTIVLTHVRSRPYLEQIFGRGIRVDRKAGAYENQKSYVWVPDDPMMNQVIEDIRSEQEGYVIEHNPNPEKSNGQMVANTNSIVPLSSNATRGRAADLEGAQSLSYDQTQSLETFMQLHGINASPIEVYNIIINSGGSIPEFAINDEVYEVPVTPRDEINQLRQRIENYVRQYEHKHSIEFGMINRQLKAHFGKSRREMTKAELLETWQFLLDNCGDGIDQAI